MENYTHWFYLESYTFLFYSKNQYVIYNTLNSTYIDCSLYGKTINTVLSILHNTNKTYCVGIYEYQLRDSQFTEFIKKIRNTFSGDIIKNIRGIPPFISKPILRILHHPNNPKTKEYNLLGENALFHLHEVTFYLENQGFDLNPMYKDCYKQFLYPTYTEKQKLSHAKYLEIIEQLSICQIDKINIIPATIEKKELFSYLLSLSRQYSIKTQIILPYKKYNKEDFHIHHGKMVEGTMRYFAEKLGYGDEVDFWGTVGLLHDIDFEMWPEEHCKKAPELLREAGIDERMIHAVVCHGYGLCSDVEPEHEMEKVLFACDELTGLIGAAALMRPSKSCKDMELKSLKKKFKDKRFAAGCDREVIIKGAQMLGWELDELLNETLEAMKTCEDA